MAAASWGEGERLAHSQWQGAEVKFMQANEHSRERQGVWDTSGLQGAALSLVQQDEQAARYPFRWPPLTKFSGMSLGSCDVIEVYMVMSAVCLRVIHGFNLPCTQLLE